MCYFAGHQYASLDFGVYSCLMQYAGALPYSLHHAHMQGFYDRAAALLRWILTLTPYKYSIFK